MAMLSEQMLAPIERLKQEVVAIYDGLRKDPPEFPTDSAVKDITREVKKECKRIASGLKILKRK